MPATPSPIQPGTIPMSPPDRLGGHLVAAYAGAFTDNLFRGVVAATLMLLAEHHVGAKNYEALVLGTAYGIYAGMAFLIPMVLLAPLAGALGDRLPKHRPLRAIRLLDLVVCLLGSIGVFLKVGGHEDASLIVLLATLAVLGGAATVFGSVKFSALPELVRPERLASANAWMQGVSMAAILMGLAATALAEEGMVRWLGCGAYGPAVAVLGISAVVSVLGIIAAWRIPKLQAQAPQTPLRPFAWASTLGALRAGPGILAPTMALAGFWAIGSAAQVMIAPIAFFAFGFEAGGQALLALVMGIGIIAGSALAPVLMRRAWPAGLPMLGALIAGAAMLLAGGVAGHALQHQDLAGRDAYWFGGLLFLAGIGGGFWEVPLQILIQERSPAAVRNRVMAATQVMTCIGMVVAMFACLALLKVSGLDAAGILRILAGVSLAFTAGALWIYRNQVAGWALSTVAQCIWRIRLRGTEHLPASGGCLVVCNHLSYADGLIVGLCLPRPGRFLVFRRFVDMPVVGWFLHWAGVIPVSDTDARRSKLAAIDAAIAAAKAGEMVVIFPEGKLTRSGQMDVFFSGMERIAGRAGVPVVPAYLHGLFGTWMSRAPRRGWSWWPRILRRVNLRFGPVMPSTTSAAQARDAVVRLSWEFADERARADRRTLGAEVLRNARRRPTQTAVIDAGGELTAWKLAAIAQAVIPLLGLAQAERRVGVLLPPGRGGSIVNLAIALSGRTAVNLNHTVGDAMLARCCELAEVKTVITAGLYVRKIGNPTVPGRTVLVEELLPKLGSLTVLGHAALNLLLPASWRDASRADDVAAIIFSSGSTGDPKGVQLTHRQILANILATAEGLDLHGGEDRLLSPLPLFHSFGLVPGFWLATTLGIPVMVNPDPNDGKGIGELAGKHKPTFMMSTPTFVRGYLRRITKEQLASLRFCVVGAERCPAELRTQFKEMYGGDLLEGYGCTELAPVVSVNLPWVSRDGLVEQRSRDGAVGRALPGIHVFTVDPETGAELPLGSDGLLVVRSPARMQGYLRRDDLTTKAFLHGGYNTGDVGHVDKDGFIFITGRLARFAKIGGEMVPLDNVEAALATTFAEIAGHESGIEIAVSATPDPARGERLVVLHTGWTGDWAALIEKLNHLPPLWRPKTKDVVKVESIPKLGTGKRDLAALKRLAAGSAT